MSAVVKEMNTVKDLVLNVLANYPKTRNDDTLLYLECCRELGAINMDDIEDLGLSIVSVHKIRQKIQNSDKMFMPDGNVRQIRLSRARHLREYMRKSS